MSKDKWITAEELDALATQPGVKDLLGTTEAAQLVRCHQEELRAAIDSGALPSRVLGASGKYRIVTLTDLIAWRKENIIERHRRYSAAHTQKHERAKQLSIAPPVSSEQLDRIEAKLDRILGELRV